MQICRELGGYSYGQADLVRRAMSKKKVAVMEKEREHFLEGCKNNGISSSVANRIFDDMSSFASYAFNKSHAAAYALVAYQTAYLKCHYQQEFMAALLTSVLDSTDKVIEYIDECSRLSIPVLPPSINQSEQGFTVTDQGIRFGLLAVKNLGSGVIQQIIAQRRSDGEYRSFTDFYSRLYGSELNKRSLESLIRSGAMDNLGSTRRSMLEGYSRIGSLLAEENLWKSTGQTSLFGDGNTGSQLELPVLPEYDHRSILTMEKEVTGLYLSGHPMSGYRQYYQQFMAVQINRLMDSEVNQRYDNATVNIMAIVAAKRLKLTRSNDNMAFVTFEDSTGSIESLVFARIYEEYSQKLTVGEAVFATGRLSIREDEAPKFILEKLETMEERIARGTVKTDAPSAASGKTSKAQGGQKPGLYLRVPAMQSPAMEKVTCLLSIFDGATPVYLLPRDTGKLLRAPRTMWADTNDMLVSQLTQVLGDENVKILL